VVPCQHAGRVRKYHTAVASAAAYCAMFHMPLICKRTSPTPQHPHHVPSAYMMLFSSPCMAKSAMTSPCRLSVPVPPAKHQWLAACCSRAIHPCRVLCTSPQSTPPALAHLVHTIQRSCCVVTASTLDMHDTDHGNKATAPAARSWIRMSYVSVSTHTPPFQTTGHKQSPLHTLGHAIPLLACVPSAASEPVPPNLAAHLPSPWRCRPRPTGETHQHVTPCMYQSLQLPCGPSASTEDEADDGAHSRSIDWYIHGQQCHVCPC
jgi:hypothetical protein